MKAGDFVRTAGKGILDRYVGYIRAVTEDEEHPFRVEFANGWAFSLAAREIRPTNESEYVPDSPRPLFSDDPMASLVLDMLPSSAITNPVEFIRQVDAALRERFPGEAFTSTFSETLAKTAAAYYDIAIIYPEIEVSVVGGQVVVQEKEKSWRDDPASEKQLAYLAQLNVEVPAGTTKGRASEMIEQMKRYHLRNPHLYILRPVKAQCYLCWHEDSPSTMIEGGEYDWDNPDPDLQGSVSFLRYHCADTAACRGRRGLNAELAQIAAEVAEAGRYDDHSPGQIGAGW